MTDAEKLEDFPAVELDVAAPSVQECHDEKRGSVESPTYDGPAAPLAEGTTTHDLSEWNNVEPEPSPVDNNIAPAQTRPSLPSFAQSEFYTVMFCLRPYFDCDSCSCARARVLTPSFRLDRPPSAPQAR